MAQTALTEDTRPAAVAGQFYPDQAAILRDTLAPFLAAAKPDHTRPPPVPKALIAPHAGYVYSGAAAGAGYRRLRPAHDLIRRVVLIGPAHRVAVNGLATSGKTHFATPLGRVPVDREGVAEALAIDGVEINDLAHRDEHSLEVHLPFLQSVLDDFAIVPLVVGHDTTGIAARVLAQLWGGPETLIAVSSDLSHYLTYEHARQLDAATCAAILAFDGASIGRAQACGRAAIKGLLDIAQRKGLSPETVALCNSGDTAGPRDRVVGYGTWAFGEPQPSQTAVDPELGADEAAAEGILHRYRSQLLAVAAASIRSGLRSGKSLSVAIEDKPADLCGPGATFVTLQHARRLRGCIGSLVARRPLIVDVAANAFAAAFQDRRFKPLRKDEFDDLTIKISFLTRPIAFPVDNEQDLIARLRPGVDGLLLHHGGYRGVFLPSVWDSIPAPGDFVSRLKMKAGLDPDLWSNEFQFQRFSALEISSAAYPSVAARRPGRRVFKLRRSGTERPATA